MLAEFDKLTGQAESNKQMPISSTLEQNDEEDDADETIIELSSIVGKLKTKNIIIHLSLIINSSKKTLLKGSKCRIPYECPVTDLKMHNAIVLGVASLEKNTVRLFI